MSEKKQLADFDFETGEVLLLDKPLTWTSFDIVRKVKNTLRPRKIGHAGTLDPLATGLLILCTGKKTKDIDQIQAQEKEYEGTFRLGQTTPSFDRETAVDAELPYAHLTEAEIRAAVLPFLGKIEQIPPLFSAVKVDGKRAYDLARSGQEAEIKPKTVDIKAFDITRIELPEIDFRVVCSKGTYIRSLARDLGTALGVGAHLTRLVRTRIGEYKLADAWTVAEVQALRPPRPEPTEAQPDAAPTPRRPRERHLAPRVGLDYFAAQQAEAQVAPPADAAESAEPA
ncbi:tRNA pseudouridine(55) synthase TruB [Hymenobacter sp. UV11]|uniref:tRNA pseudouridine(55) synthase TruB n=1 Tax=Hymenobacter sp. UV11 TaxID=1849735 RepID=UPI00105CA29C|nr:tRNA pseudouridine(55) synthase TruB [Hymenobacter sp. UV11]TDN37514.1 tRNA pseudouridine(55) synthase TruB [Hymenobacter sp. UV11]TFZ68711.1 tRNA pseudouridine(55) synthase TruB [Hymenobacter sp. UV11]